MKRIVLLCDGTWDRADVRHPTNVVRLGQALAHKTSEDIDQVPIYVEGVGSGRRGVTPLTRALDRALGGALGLGLMDNMVEAYRHLMFTYEQGDEVYIFGFSRGAFTARTLAGFIRYTGLLARSELHHLPEAVERYTRRSFVSGETWQSRNAEWRAIRSPFVMTDPSDADVYAEFGATRAVPFNVAYMGIFDTVGSLGVPGLLTKDPIINRRHAFHDTDLSDMVLAARHAVSIDERRRPYCPTLWTNLDDLNGAAVGTPYLQQHFPGDHRGVGGGGPINDLPSLSMRWVIEGAEAQGLEFNQSVLDRIEAEGDPLGHITATEVPKGGIVSAAMRWLGKSRDDVERLDDISNAARQRWKGLPGYRPDPLKPFRADLNG